MNNQYFIIYRLIHEKSVELIRILEECRIEQENKEYEEMVKDVKHNRLILSNKLGMSSHDRMELKRVFGVFSSLINVILSMMAVFYAMFYFGDTLTRDVGMVNLDRVYFII